MDEAKVYNVCLQRVKFQITQAKQNENGRAGGKRILESYRTGEVDEIIDILELYDLDSQDRDGLHEKLEDLAYTVSLLVKETITFDYDEKGCLGLYVTMKRQPAKEYDWASATLAAAMQG